MGCRLVATDETYKLFKHSQLERIRRERFVDRGAVDEDPLSLSLSTLSLFSLNQYYSCRKCRRILATSKNVLEHEAGTGIDAFRGDREEEGTIVVRQRGLRPRPVRAFSLSPHVDDARPNRGERAGYFPLSRERFIVQNVAQKLALSRGPQPSQLRSFCRTIFSHTESKARCVFSSCEYVKHSNRSKT